MRTPAAAQRPVDSTSAAANSHRGSVFRAELWLPHPREAIFPFFADARNLELITPPWLRFRIETPAGAANSSPPADPRLASTGIAAAALHGAGPPIEMQAGAEIEYRLRIRAVPVRWKTRITHWDPPRSFVDEQLRGPYRKWVHEHTFVKQGEGTICRDRVEYAVPGGWMIDRLFVARDVERIFAYRQMKLLEIFGPAAP